MGRESGDEARASISIKHTRGWLGLFRERNRNSLFGFCDGIVASKLSLLLEHFGKNQTKQFDRSRTVTKFYLLLTLRIISFL